MVLGTIGGWDASGKSGPGISLPAMALPQAVEMTKKFLMEEYENDGDKEFETFKKECIVTSVEYTKRFVQESGESRKVTDLGEWCWVVVFTHPRQKDHSFTFALKPNGKVAFLDKSI